jgi:hypothetical protein
LGILGPLKTTFSVIGSLWWLYLPVLFTAGAITGWVNYVTQRYLLSLKWVLLEIKPPPDVEKSPKIAENIFSGLHASYQPVKWKKRFVVGEVPDWYSLELVGNGGDIHFFIRVREAFRKVVENIIFAQYPDAEIKEADDYILTLPKYLPSENYDLFGSTLIFTKEDAYPIRTYPFFEEESGRGESKRTDPLAPLAEAMASLQPGEHIWLQILIRPTGDSWVKEAQKVVDKIIGKEVKRELSFEGKAVEGVGKVFSSLFEATGIIGSAEKKEEKKKEDFNLQKLTPGQKLALEQVEYKIAKLGFKTNIRFIYLARKELFNRSHISSVIGMFKQLYSNNMNTFRPDPKTITFHKGLLRIIFPSDKGFFAKQLEFKRKTKIYKNYRARSFIKKVLILNTEELATLFHLPGIGLKAPAFPRVEAKRGQPPAGLPTK